MTTTIADPLAGPSALRDIIRPQFHQNNFIEENYIKNELGIKLDKGQSFTDNLLTSVYLISCYLHLTLDR